MSFVNLSFFIFVASALVLYYIMPRATQWVWLLVFSYVYYLSFGTRTIFFIIFTTVTTYACAILIEKVSEAGKTRLSNTPKVNVDDKKAIKAKMKHDKRVIMILCLILNFGMLSLIKYGSFFVGNINTILDALNAGKSVSFVQLAIPIGISFYTFQSMGYIIDVYQGKYEPERNLFKFALFVSFFPQIMQGPIGRFDKLAHQFFEEHRFNLQNIEFGVQLILCGLLKKMVLADRAAVYVNLVFSHHNKFGGVSIIVAVLLYSVELYADFSGGIDIIRGTAQMFGIDMDNNFARPFFSKSIGEFWRRWHITLGTWMKDYIFYPFSLSKVMNRFGRFSKDKFGKTIGRVLPICLANLLIFFIVGIWHGAAWKYIAYGMYNGIIIASSNLLEPVYTTCRHKLHINAEARGWKLFQIFRTFVLINIGWYFDMAGSFKDAIKMMWDTIYYFNFAQLTDGTIFRMGMKPKDFIIILGGCAIWLIISLLQEKNIRIRETLAKKALVIRWAVYIALLFAAPIFGYLGETQAFIYAQF